MRQSTDILFRKPILFPPPHNTKFFGTDLQNASAFGQPTFPDPIKKKTERFFNLTSGHVLLVRPIQHRHRKADGDSNNSKCFFFHKFLRAYGAIKFSMNKQRTQSGHPLESPSVCN